MLKKVHCLSYQTEITVKVLVNGQFWDTFIRSQAKQKPSFI